MLTFIVMVATMQRQIFFNTIFPAITIPLHHEHLADINDFFIDQFRNDFRI